MECPSCGYILDPFEKECPRCKRLGEKGTAPPPTPRKAPAVPEGDPVRKITREYATRPTPKGPDEVETDLPVGYEPPLGWPLTAILWVLALSQGVLIIYAMAVDYDIFTAITLGSREIATVGLLYCQRWAFRLFALTTVLPAVISLMTSGADDMIKLAAFIVPAILVFILGYARLDDLE